MAIVPNKALEVDPIVPLKGQPGNITVRGSENLLPGSDRLDAMPYAFTRAKADPHIPTRHPLVSPTIVGNFSETDSNYVYLNNCSMSAPVPEDIVRPREEELGPELVVDGVFSEQETLSPVWSVYNNGSASIIPRRGVRLFRPSGDLSGVIRQPLTAPAGTYWCEIDINRVVSPVPPQANSASRRLMQVATTSDNIIHTAYIGVSGQRLTSSGISGMFQLRIQGQSEDLMGMAFDVIIRSVSLREIIA